MKVMESAKNECSSLKRGARFRLAFLCLLAAVASSLFADVQSGSLVADYAYCAKLTVTGYDAKKETLANFPVLVRVSPSKISGFQYSQLVDRAAGSDLCFVDMIGNGLPFEIDTWNPDGESLVWVTLPLMKNGTDFMMCWGSATSGKTVCADNPFADYYGVWHMNEANAKDSTPNHLDGTADASIAVVAAKLGKGTEFPSSATNTTKIQTANVSNAAFRSAISFETWAYPYKVSDKHALFGKENLATFKFQQGNTWFTTPNKKDFEVKESIAANSWYHIVLTFVPSRYAKVYVNGELKKTQNDDGGFYDLSLSRPVVFGNNQWTEYYNGILDECRLLTKELSADWIAASYATQNEAAFLAYDDAKPLSCGVTWGEGMNGGTSVKVVPRILDLVLEEGKSATLKVLYGTAADALTETVTVASPVAADCAVPVTVKGLMRGTTYYFKAVLVLPGDQLVESEVLPVTTIADYTTAMRRVEYIEGTGTQYIDSGYYPGPSTHVKADYQFTAKEKQYRVFGVEGGDFWYQCYINGNGYWAYIYADVASDNWNPVSGNIPANTERHLFDFNYIYGEGNRAYTIYGTNGTVTATQSPLETTGATKNASLSLVIGGMRSSATEVKCIAKHRIYSVQFDEGSALTAALAPAVRATDGAVGLYDSVRNRFLPSASTVAYVLGPSMTTVEHYTGSALTAIDLTFLGAPMARTLKVAYGSGFGGDNPADWDATETVATVAAGETSCTVTAIPENWGSDDACVLRCYFDDGTSFPLWSDTIVYKATLEPSVSITAVDGTGGDKLIVRGNLGYFPGDDCTLSVRVTKSGGSPVVWSNLTNVTETGSFELTLLESDPTAPRYIEPGAVYSVVVEAESGETSGSSSPAVATTKGAPVFASSSSSVNQRKVTFAGNLADLGANTNAMVTLYVGETADSLVPVEDPVSRKETGSFNIAHTFDTFDKTYYWQLCAVATTAGGNAITTRTAVASCNTLDKTTYTWQAVEGDWNGDWEDPAHWSPSNADCFGYPQSSAAMADFANCTTSSPVVVNVHGKYTVGTFKCYGSAASDIAFVGTGTNTSSLTGGGYYMNSIASDSTLEFRDMALTLNGNWELLRDKDSREDKTNVTFRLSGVTGSTTGYFALAAGYCRAEFLNGTDFTGGMKFNIGGTNTVVVIDDSTIRANGSMGFLFNADSKNAGGMRHYFRGKAPRMLSSTTFYPYSHNPDINHQLIFEVPIGGYAEAPIQFTHASTKMFQGGHATADYHVIISPDSPAFKRSGEKLENVPLIYAKAGFDLTVTRTMTFEPVEYKGEPSGKLSWGVDDVPLADGEQLSKARQILLDLRGKKPPTVIKLR